MANFLQQSTKLVALLDNISNKEWSNDSYGANCGTTKTLNSFKKGWDNPCNCFVK